MQRFEGKVALITGAASGIGRATADRLASEGARVFCVDVQRQPVEEAAKAAASQHGVETDWQVCDVSDAAAVETTVQACIARFGQLDVLCNMAGILRMDKTHELELAAWDKVIAVNLTGTFLMCKAAIPHLLATKGNIVNAASTAALAGLPWGAAYGASKGGVLALTRTIAVEYGKLGLRCNSVCPGSIETPMTHRDMLPKDVDRKLVFRAMPLTQFRGPEYVASVIAMLASEDGGHINGESIRVDDATLA